MITEKQVKKHQKIVGNLRASELAEINIKVITIASSLFKVDKGVLLARAKQHAFKSIESKRKPDMIENLTYASAYNYALECRI